MKKIIVILICIIFAQPSLATSNKVELTEDTIIRLNDTNINLIIKSGSIFERLVVNSNNIEIVTGSGDSVTIQSEDRKQLSNNNNLQTTCPSNGTSPSSLIISGSGDVTITPLSDQCTIQSNGGGGSLPPPPAGSGESSSNIDMGETRNIGTVNSGGTNVMAYIDSSAIFSTVVSSNYQSQEHRFEISNLDLLNNIITIIIYSDPKTIVLNLNDIAKVDLDNDNIPDLEIKFADLYINRAELTVKSLLENTSEEFENYEGKLIKHANSSDVYYIEKGKKRPILSAAVFNSYGFNWNDVITVDNIDSYLDGDILANANYRLIKYSDSPKVYLIENNKKRWITTEEIFIARRFGWGFIETLDDDEVYENGEDIDSEIIEGDLIKYVNSPKVYLIENNKKRWIKTEDAFVKKGYLWSDIYVASSNESNFEDGQDIVD